MRTLSEAILAISDSAQLLLLAKATLALMLGLAAVRMARSVRASVRHLLLTSTFGVLLALPLVMAVAPVVRLEIPTTSLTPAVATSAKLKDTTLPMAPATDSVPTTTPASDGRISKSRPFVFRGAWAIGAALFFTWFAIALWRLRTIRRCGVPWLEGNVTIRTLSKQTGVRRQVEVLLHNGILVPVTSGWLRPAILLPADASAWNEPDLRRALVHELEHVRRGDWLVHLLARSICALYWFHPLAWVAWRQLCLEAERACDDAVLLGAERADYAEQLVILARRLSNALAPPVLSMANRSDLSRRVSAILDSNQPRGRVGLLYSTAALTVAAVVALAIAPVRAVGTSAGRLGLVSMQQPASTAPRVQGEHPQLDRALLEASESGDVSDITKLLDAGADVNAALQGDGSPLIVAAREGHIAAVQLLLERGANPNLGVPGDGSAIIMAAREGHESVVRLLLDSGASIDLIVPEDENALIQASGRGQLSVVKLLVSRGADVNARVWVGRSVEGLGSRSVEGLGGRSNGEWRTPLSMARKRGANAVIEYLLSVGAHD